MHDGLMDGHREADLTFGPCLDQGCPTGRDPGPEWITYVQAAELIKTTVATMVRDGRLVSRHPWSCPNPSRPIRSVHAAAPAADIQQGSRP